MADDESLVLYAPEGNLTSVSVDAGDGPVTYGSDATGKVSNVDARHKQALLDAGFTTGRTTASARDNANKAAS